MSNITFAATSDDPPVRIAAASSLQFVLNEIIEAYVEETGNTVPQIVYGSSGNLFRQIMQGAPFDIFLSADNELVDKLQSSNITIGTAVEFGAGRLVLYTKNDSAPAIEDFRQLLAQGEDKLFKVSIANPRHAPFGRAAQQALESLNLWELTLPRLVFAEKVSQAAQFALTGATEFALISRSLALSDTLKKTGSYTLIPAEHHRPIVQAMILITDNSTAGTLFNFIRSAESASDTLQRFGLR